MRISDWSSDVCSSDRPVAHVLALAIDRQRPALQRRKDHQRDQLLGKLVGAVVVGAVAGDNRTPVGMVPGAHEEIGRASWRESECQYVSISVVAVSLKKKQTSI